MQKRVLLLFIVSLFLYSCSQSPTEPERPTINIRFSVYEDGHVSLIIYDQFDMLVKTLVNEELSSGDHYTSWDCKNEDGQTVACGLYYCTFKFGEYENTMEMPIFK